MIWLPKLAVALIIWWVGAWILSFLGNQLRKIDILKSQVDNKFLNQISMSVVFLGKLFLGLILLDYLGVGEGVITALTQGIAFTISIALGISFGKALEPEARKMVESTKKYISTK